jgi:hypothetical protein
MNKLGVSALLTGNILGEADSKIDWVAPTELERAALRLRELVFADHPETARIVETYASRQTTQIRSARSLLRI